MKIFVRAKPNSRVPKVEQESDKHFVVAVREEPKDGQANIAIQEALAKHFNVSVSRVKLTSGFTSRNKVFDVN